jgi:hypothetical protein
VKAPKCAQARSTTSNTFKGEHPSQKYYGSPKASGEKLGRPKALDDKRAAAARALLETGATVSAVAKQFDTSRQTIMRVRDASVDA